MYKFKSSVCITDDDVLSKMKAKEEEKAEEDRQKLEKKRVCEEKRIEREMVKKEKEEGKRLKQLEKGNTRSAKSKMLVKRGSSEDKIMSGEQGVDLSEKLELLHVESEVDAICPKCGLSNFSRCWEFMG